MPTVESNYVEDLLTRSRDFYCLNDNNKHTKENKINIRLLIYKVIYYS